MTPSPSPRRYAGVIDFSPLRLSCCPSSRAGSIGGGGRIHYVDAGPGQPILMLDGKPTWSFLYRHLIEKVRGQLRCVAVDLAGFGLSERLAEYGYTPAEQAAVVGELVRELDLRDLIVMAHDWGGPIGCRSPSPPPSVSPAWFSAVGPAPRGIAFGGGCCTKRQFEPESVARRCFRCAVGPLCSRAK